MEFNYEMTEEQIYQQEKAQYREEDMVSDSQADAQDKVIDLSYAGLRVAVKDISSLIGTEEFTIARRKGLGTSDSSVVLGVNPYKTRKELIKEKASDTLSEEEKAIGQKASVRMGNDLEPVIIAKFSKFFNLPCWKPTDMYEHTQYPYIKYNFDGITGVEGAYVPAEIKVVTARGEKHYNPEKAIFNEQVGFKQPPADVTRDNISIVSKAFHYGIPPYYYTQLQQEIMGCGSDFGYLSVLFARNWEYYTFFVHRDEAVINAIITEGYKVWEQVCSVNPERCLPEPGLASTSTEL